MPSLESQPLLFGLDLKAVWRDAASVAREWGGRAPLAWLAPTVRVQLLGSDGRQLLWKAGPSGLRPLAQGKAEGAPFVAVEVAEQWLLRSRLTLPRMAADQVETAVRLEVLRLSPFPEPDTVWGFVSRASSADSGLLEVDLVLAAREHVQACLAASVSGGGSREPEAWALAQGPAAMVLRGFGEASRERSIRRGFGWAVFCLLLALVWGTALALTPSLQLRARALDAQAQFTELAQAARPAVAEREALMRDNEHLKVVDDLLASRADPKLAIEVLTKALDDGTYLQRMEVKGRNVSISGQTGNATALAQFLSGQKGLEDVRSSAAATRQGSGSERFSIDFVLKRPPPPEPGAPPASEGASAASVTAATAATAAAPVSAAPSAPAASPPASTQGSVPAASAAPAKAPEVKR